MAKPNSRATLIKYCKRALGAPVIEINIDDDQIDDRIDEALQFYQHYHTDATEKVFLKHQVTQTDIDNEYIPITEVVTDVVRVLPISQSSSISADMFDVKYQMHLNDMYKLGYMGNILEYVQTQQHMSTVDLLLYTFIYMLKTFDYKAAMINASNCSYLTPNFVTSIAFARCSSGISSNVGYATVPGSYSYQVSSMNIAYR